MNFKNVMNQFKKSALGSKIFRSFGEESVSSTPMPSPSKNEEDWVLHTPGGEMPDPSRSPVDRNTIGESGSISDTGSVDYQNKKKAA